MRYITALKFTALLLAATGCEPFYDPVENYDVPPSMGSTWNREPIVVKETVENPFDIADLSGTMPLSFLLDMALYNNPLTRASWNAARASAYGYRSSLSTYYPSLLYVGSINAQTNKGTSYATSGQGVVSTPGVATTSSSRKSTNLSNDVSLTYLLLDFGGRSSNAELAREVLRASDWQHNLTMQQVMLSVITSYTSYIGNKGLVNAYREDVKDFQVAFDAAKLMHSAGLATLTDVLLAQSNLELSRSNLIQSEGLEKTSLGEILINVGLPPDANISVEDLPQELPVVEISGDISGLLELAKLRRPDLGVAIAAIKQQEAQLGLSYSNSMPNITANANWNQIRFLHPQKPSGYNESVFFQLNFPIFDGFYYMNQQRQIRAQIEEAMANLDVQLAAIYTQVITYYYSFKAAEASLPSAEAAVEAGQRAYRGFIIQYKTGTASILDVLNGLTTLSNARSQLILARTQWASALANLAFSVGVLEDTSGHWQKAPPKKLEKLPIRDDNVPQITYK